MSAKMRNFKENCINEAKNEGVLLSPGTSGYLRVPLETD